MAFGAKLSMPTPEEALPGREQSVLVPPMHFVNGSPLVAPFPTDTAHIQFGMGCFWGAERRYWQTPGVYTTAVGYAGGYTVNPSYEEVCSGMTGHTEVVLVVFRPAEISLHEILRLFWEGHDPRVCARVMTWGPSIARRSIPTMMSSLKLPLPRATVISRHLTQRDMVRSPPRLIPRRPSTMQSIITSSIWPRYLMGIADWGEPALGVT